MITLVRELNTTHVKNVIIIEQENGFKRVFFKTHERMVPFHRASDDVYLFGEDNEIEVVEIPELKNINFDYDWMVYYSQDKDQIEVLYVPFDMFDEIEPLSI